MLSRQCHQRVAKRLVMNAGYASHHHPTWIHIIIIIIQQLKMEIIWILNSRCNSATHWLSSDINLAPYLFSSCLFNNRSHNNHIVNNVQFTDDNYFPRDADSKSCLFIQSRWTNILYPETTYRSTPDIPSPITYEQILFKWSLFKVLQICIENEWKYLSVRNFSPGSHKNSGAVDEAAFHRVISAFNNRPGVEITFAL